jgi:photosystem II stability/assembly factor-like uncharacterized protein
VRIEILRRGFGVLLLGLVLLAAPAVARAGDGIWTRFGPATGEGLAFALDPIFPNTSYFSQAHGGLSKSVDGGLSWARLSALDGETVLAIAPVGSSLFVVVTGGRILRSDNHGRSWTTVYDGEVFQGVPPNTLAGNRLVVVPRPGGLDFDIFMRLAAGIYRSRDQGESWELVLAGSSEPGGAGGIAALAAAPSGTLYAGFSTTRVSRDALLKSTDGGDTWQPAGVPVAGFPGDGVQALAVLPTSPTSPETILAASAQPGLFRSTDGGATWQQASLRPDADGFASFVYAITPDPTAPGSVYATAYTAFWRSTDAGRTWQRQGPEPANGIFTLAVDPATRILYAGGFGGVSRTGNGGRRWRQVYAVNFQPAFGFIRFHPTEPATIYLTGEKLYRSGDLGRTWSSIGLSIGGPDRSIPINDLAFDPEDPSILYAGGRMGVHRSRDAGKTFVTLPGTELTFVSTLAVLDSRTLIAGGCGIRRSADGGETWRTVFACERPGATDESDRSVRELWVDRQTPSVLYAEMLESDGRHPVNFYWNLYTSADGGRSWRLLLRDSAAMALDPARPRTIYAARAEGILRSDDGGRSWRRISSFAPGIVDLQPDPSAPSTLYAASEARGVYRSTDGGVTWAPINAGLPRLVGRFRFRQLAVHPTQHRVYLETGDDKLWQVRFGG